MRLICDGASQYSTTDYITMTAVIRLQNDTFFYPSSKRSVIYFKTDIFYCTADHEDTELTFNIR